MTGPHATKLWDQNGDQWGVALGLDAPEFDARTDTEGLNTNVPKSEQEDL